MAATKRKFTLSSGIGISASNIYLSDTANSTSSTIGSFVSEGGVGIGESISISGRLQLFNNSNYTAFVSSASGNTVYTLPATSPATGSSVLQSTSAGVMSWVPMVASGGGSGTVNNGTLNSIPYYPATGTAITGSSSFTNVGTGISITYSTPSTSSTTGALVVTGGVGIGDTLFVAGNISVNTGTNGLLFRKLVAGNYGAIYSTNVTPSSTNYTMITDGASVNFNGTNGVYFNINNTNKIQVTTNNVNVVPTAGSSSTSTGALTVAGGVGIGGNAFIGGTVNVTNTTAATGVSTAALVVSGGLGVNGDVYVANSVGSKLFVMQSSGDEGGEIFLNKPVTNTTISSGVTVDIYQNRLRFFEEGGSNRGFYLDITSGGNGAGTNIMGGASSGTVNSGTATFAAFYAASSNAVSENANLQFTGTGISIGGNINSTSTRSGSLYVNGGFGVTGNAFIGGTVTITSASTSTNTSSGAFVVTGGVGIGGSLYVASATAISGVTINAGVITGSLAGTATSSGFATTAGLATTATYATQSGYAITSGSATTSSNVNIVSAASNSSHRVLFTPATGTASGAAVSIETSFVYNPFTDNLSVSGLAVTSTTNSTSTTSGSLQVRGGVGITGTVYIGEVLNATSSAASTSSTTGALVVTGGVGIGENVHIGGNLAITQSTEKFLSYTTNIGSGTTVSLAVNTSGGIIYVHTGTVSGNWTLNLTGLATTNGFASSVTLIIAQGSTPYVPSTLSISGVGQTVNWQGGSVPSGNANKKDAFNYSILSTGSGVTDYVIFGQLVSFG